MHSRISHHHLYPQAQAAAGKPQEAAGGGQAPAAGPCRLSMGCGYKPVEEGMALQARVNLWEPHLVHGIDPKGPVPVRGLIEGVVSTLGALHWRWWYRLDGKCGDEGDHSCIMLCGCGCPRHASTFIHVPMYACACICLHVAAGGRPSPAKGLPGRLAAAHPSARCLSRCRRGCSRGHGHRWWCDRQGNPDPP